MNDVKKTWCGPVYTLDPEKMERQFNRLSAEGWQLEGTGLAFLPLSSWSAE